MAVAGIILAGSAIWDAYQKHKANEKAEKQLTEANTNATQIAGNTKAENSAVLSPYTTLGAGAAGLLGNGLGIDMSGVSLGGGGAPIDTSPKHEGVQDLTANRVTGDRVRPWDSPITGTAVTRPGTNGRETGAGVQRASGYGAQSMVPMAPVAAPAGVTLRDPQGNTGEVPANELPRYLAAGYQQVSA